MAAMEPDSIDAIVCDPPYGLEFMGNDWDELERPKAGSLGGFADGNKPSFERVWTHLPAMQDWDRAWTVEARVRMNQDFAFLSGDRLPS